MVIAALYVDPKGIYSGLEGVDCWGEDRDARLYAGPHPVVAHPPCTRWCVLAGQQETRYGIPKHKDDGEFAAACKAVRRFGGVLEHPGYSAAFGHHGLSEPASRGWQRDIDGGWVCEVFQGAYGHRVPKRTWLYVCGVDEPPALNWSLPEGKGSREFGMMSHKQRSATPEAFRDVLIGIARRAGRCSRG